MLILGIDTATGTASGALVEGQRLLAEVVLAINPKTHSERLLPVIDRLLTGAGIELQQVDGFAVGVGPGSFTGLRIAVGTVQGFAYALNKPVVPVSTLDALAQGAFFPGALTCPLLDAKQGYIYTALYQGEASGPRRVSDYQALTPPEIGQLLLPGDQPVVLVGDGVPLCREVLAGLGPRAHFPPDPAQQARAAHVALLGAARLATGPADPMAVKPLYVRKSAAELNLEKRCGQQRKE